jgi:hypothetical protein
MLAVLPPGAPIAPLGVILRHRAWRAVYDLSMKADQRGRQLLAWLVLGELRLGHGSSIHGRQ